MKEDIGGKVCKCCGKFKAFRFYYKSNKSKDGYRSKCKSCEKEQQREIHSREHPVTLDEKYCPCCKRTLPIEMFSKDPTQTTGVHSWCKECMSEEKKHNQSKKMLEKPNSRQNLLKR